MKLKFPISKSARAFTLIEIMLSIMIFSIVVAAIYSTWTLVLRSSRVGIDAAAQAQRQRIAMRTIEDGLTCIQSFEASMQYYSFIVVNGPQPELSFTARLPDTFPRNGKFGDFNSRRLTFTVEAPPGAANNFSGQPQEQDLVLRQNPILMQMDADELQSPLVLAKNVQAFTIECWDTNTLAWDTEWDDTNSIPPLIRVSLVLGGNKNSSGELSPTLSVIRVVSMPSETLPTTVQMPSGNGGGGGAGGFGGARNGNRGGNNRNGNGRNNGQNGNRNGGQNGGNGGNNGFGGGGGNFNGGNNNGFGNGFNKGGGQ
jgi:prepilin-type N-terminal cleavage/methylation domain-containing protein